MKLVEYTYIDWENDIETRKSMPRYAFHLVSGAISRSSKKQLIVALSTLEAEYFAGIGFPT